MVIIVIYFIVLALCILCYGIKYSNSPECFEAEDHLVFIACSLIWPLGLILIPIYTLVYLFVNLISYPFRVRKYKRFKGVKPKLFMVKFVWML